ncbi:hypothetical protein [Paraburkholderia sp. J76]|uniref:hypothetical protein n=1 Tax=Paraburkholderia sp. J76 TaxID=2805439 RepID=UPI002ABE7E97|nr:hypothetical protein [Paraburkholderia sp. J76]
MQPEKRAQETTPPPLEPDDRADARPAHAEPGERDEREKRRHEKSENELPSTQDKNPIPPGTTQRTS